MTTLVMFSGGLDSTAMLLKLLEETQDELHVHHIRMENRQGRDGAEQRATEQVIAWCRAHCRGFRYSESGLDFRALQAIPIDYLCVAFVACQVAIDTPGCDRIAVGTLAVDLDEVRRSVTSAQRQVFEAMYACYRARKVGEPSIEWIYPVYTMGKTEIVLRLPVELREAAWSCRTPVHTSTGYRVCGQCKPCRKRAEVSEALSIAL